MSKARNSARGQDCTARIPGYCNGNPETTVLAHLPGGGMARKRRDIHGAYCCSDCHDVLDGRRKTPIDRPTLQLWHLEAVIRTQEVMIAEGIIKC